MSVLLSVQEMTSTGVAAVFHAAAAAGNHFANDGNVLVEIHNGHTGPWTVTINSIAPCNQGFDHDVVISIPAGARWRLPTLDPGRFNNAAGHVSLTYSGVTALNVSLVRR